MERVSRHRQATLIVDALDRLERGEPGGHQLLEEKTDQVAVEGADLLADHHVDAELGTGERPLPGPEGPADLVVIRDGKDVQASPHGVHDGFGALRPVAPQRVYVQVCATVGTGPHRGQV